MSFLTILQHNNNSSSILLFKIKFREGFRPFAPCILSDDLQSWFDLDIQSNYMLFVAEILNKHKLDNKKSTIPAVTHVDFSARVQNVNEKNENMIENLMKNNWTYNERK